MCHPRKAPWKDSGQARCSTPTAAVFNRRPGMNLFSHRKGLKPAQKSLQRETIDGDLRTALWNSLCFFYWSKAKAKWWEWMRAISGLYDINSSFGILFFRIWTEYLKRPVDDLPRYIDWAIKAVKDYFFKCPWNECYDLIEYVSTVYTDQDTNGKFQRYCNSTLEREASAYRFVGSRIVEMTSLEEIQEVEAALALSDSFAPVSTHLRRALDLLADRKSPDYRNSIKESISAVEAVSKLLAEDSKADLAQALRHIKAKAGLHPALEKAFIQMYGYTSDADGIRHALIEEPSVRFEDAKFMLVACSAFVNYLRAKAQKAGLISVREAT